MSELQSYVSRLETLKSELPSIVATEARQAMIEVTAIMSSQFMRKGEGNNEQSVTAPSSSNKIGIGSGVLYRSFIPGNENNKYSVLVEGGVINIRSESKLKYAVVHDKGMFIKSKGKMEGFFWYKFKETNNPYYRALALGVRKRGGVMIPARPFIGVSIERWKESRSDAMTARIIKRISSAL